jgi:hypothetical protein
MSATSPKSSPKDPRRDLTETVEFLTMAGFSQPAAEEVFAKWKDVVEKFPMFNLSSVRLPAELSQERFTATMPVAQMMTTARRGWPWALNHASYHNSSQRSTDRFDS